MDGEKSNLCIQLLKHILNMEITRLVSHRSVGNKLCVPIRNDFVNFEFHMEIGRRVKVTSSSAERKCSSFSNYLTCLTTHAENWIKAFKIN